MFEKSNTLAGPPLQSYWISRDDQTQEKTHSASKKNKSIARESIIFQCKQASAEFSETFLEYFIVPFDFAILPASPIFSLSPESSLILALFQLMLPLSNSIFLFSLFKLLLSYIFLNPIFTLQIFPNYILLSRISSSQFTNNYLLSSLYKIYQQFFYLYLLYIFSCIIFFSCLFNFFIVFIIYNFHNQSNSFISNCKHILNTIFTLQSLNKGNYILYISFNY